MVAVRVEVEGSEGAPVAVAVGIMVMVGPTTDDARDDKNHITWVKVVSLSFLISKFNFKIC